MDPNLLEDCWFYHVMDLPGLGTINHFGSWDLRGRFDEYIAGTPIAGKTFLDVGTASGFLTFEAEKRGAIVTSFDLKLDGDSPEAILNSKMRAGYWLAHDRMGSHAAVIYGDVHSLSALAPPSDVVLLGQILVHLANPAEVVLQACKLAKETLIIAEGIFEHEEPMARYVGALDVRAYWHFSTGLYRKLLDMSGFDITQLKRGMYRCNHPYVNGDAEICTLVATRR